MPQIRRTLVDQELDAWHSFHSPSSLAELFGCCVSRAATFLMGMVQANAEARPDTVTRRDVADHELEQSHSVPWPTPGDAMQLPLAAGYCHKTRPWRKTLYKRRNARLLKPGRTPRGVSILTSVRPSRFERRSDAEHASL